ALRQLATSSSCKMRQAASVELAADLVDFLPLSSWCGTLEESLTAPSLTRSRLGLASYRLLLVALVLAVCLAAIARRPDARPGRGGLPDRLTDQEFWRLSADLSEPDGAFRSDNLVSNEVWLQYVIPDLLKTARPAGVYLGVGPEQNFTYIAAMRP